MSRVLRPSDKKLIVLNYSYGPYWDDDEVGCDYLLTVWRTRRGKLEEVMNIHESTGFIGKGNPCSREEWDDYVAQTLKERGVKKVYTPSLFREPYLLDLKIDHPGGEHEDEVGVTDWYQYTSVDDLWAENLNLLRAHGVEVEVFDKVVTPARPLTQQVVTRLEALLKPYYKGFDASGEITMRSFYEKGDRRAVVDPWVYLQEDKSELIAYRDALIKALKDLGVFE